MNIVKSTGTFGFFTIISRLLGYLRDILIAIFLGTGLLTDAFFVAFRIPNTFRRLFAEGTFNAAFVPSYSSEIIKGKKQSNKFANNIFNLLFLGLLFLTIVIEIFMPSILSPGESVPSLFLNAPTSYSPGSDEPRTACVLTTMRDPMPGEIFFVLGLRFNDAARRAGKRIQFIVFFASKS